MKKLLVLILPFLLLVGCSNEDASPKKEDVITNTDVVNEKLDKEAKEAETDVKSKTVGNEESVEETSTSTAAEESTISKEIYIQKLNDVEFSVKDLEEIVENGNQSEMNQAQDEIYKKWDAALNEVYGVLEEELSIEEMDTLRVEQRKWMEERDAAADAAADEYKGGSIQPFVYSETLTKWTKERSYELVANYME